MFTKCCKNIKKLCISCVNNNYTFLYKFYEISKYNI